MMKVPSRVHGTKPKAAIKATLRGLKVSGAVIAFIAWLPSPGFTGAGMRTYEVASVRSNATASTWPPNPDGTPRAVGRQETADGRWALEISNLDEPIEDLVHGKFLDSSGKVMWEDTIGYGNYLAVDQPAFVSELGGTLRLYNFDVGRQPLRTFTNAGLATQSSDGRVLAIAQNGVVSLVSTNGNTLGSVTLDSGKSSLCSAVTDDGRYFAIGEVILGPFPRKPMRLPTDSRPSDNPPARDQPGDTAQGVGSGATPPGPRGLVRLCQGVSVYDSAGHLLTQFSIPQGWSVPRFLALSNEAPPRIGIATDVGVSVWSLQGKLLWQDSAVFGRVGPPTVYALRLAREGRLFAVTLGGNAPPSFWAWDMNLGLEVRVPLPEPYRPGVTLVQFCTESGNSVEIQTDEGVYAVKWSTVGK